MDGPPQASAVGQSPAGHEPIRSEGQGQMRTAPDAFMLDRPDDMPCWRPGFATAGARKQPLTQGHTMSDQKLAESSFRHVINTGVERRDIAPRQLDLLVEKVLPLLRSAPGRRPVDPDREPDATRHRPRVHRNR